MNFEQLLEYLELDEAAEIDGASKLKVFFKVAVPLTVPMFVVAFIFSFVWYWNETYLTALYMPDVKTLPLQLDAFEKLFSEENMNAARAVDAVLDKIAEVCDAVANAFENGGRLFYIGAGTSGRLGVLDAAECPPTFGVDYNTVITVMAGGRDAMFRAAENVEDSAEAGKADLLAKEPTALDVVMGISASGNSGDEAIHSEHTIPPPITSR